MVPSERFSLAIAAIDEANGHDPRRERDDDGAEYPLELLYARRLTEWICRLTPQPSEALLLAARGLHIERWQIPRDAYPMNKRGYYQWKNRLKRIHADRTAEILQKVGYDADTIQRVRELILRSTFPRDPESRLIEDAVSLLFLERQFAGFAAKTERTKLVSILREVWDKMTDRAHEIALSLSLPEELSALVAEALSEPQKS